MAGPCHRDLAWQCAVSRLSNFTEPRFPESEELCLCFSGKDGNQSWSLAEMGSTLSAACASFPGEGSPGPSAWEEEVGRARECPAGALGILTTAPRVEKETTFFLRRISCFCRLNNKQVSPLWVFLLCRPEQRFSFISSPFFHHLPLLCTYLGSHLLLCFCVHPFRPVLHTVVFCFVFYVCFAP